MTSKLKAHPLAEIFPAMSDGEFEELCESISNNGQREPVTLFDGMILDGRHRYKACLQIGIDPVMENLPMGRDPVKFVIDKNIVRRHLPVSQRADLEVRCRELGSRGGDRSKTSNEVLTNKEMAAEAGVSKSSIERARRRVREERGEVDPKLPAEAKPSKTEQTEMEKQLLEDEVTDLKRRNDALENERDQIREQADRVLADEPEDSLRRKVWSDTSKAISGRAELATEAGTLRVKLDETQKQLRSAKSKLGKIKAALLRKEDHKEILERLFGVTPADD